MLSATKSLGKGVSSMGRNCPDCYDEVKRILDQENDAEVRLIKKDPAQKQHSCDLKASDNDEKQVVSKK